MKRITSAFLALVLALLTSLGSGLTAEAAPRAQTTSVQITGIPRIGQTLVAVISGSPANSKFAYTWTINGVKKAITSSLVLDETVPVGSIINLKVTSKVKGFKDFNYSSSPIAEGVISQTGKGLISGQLTSNGSNSAVGNCGTFLPSQTQESGSSTITYQWKADGTDLLGQESNTLALSESLIGKRISLRCTVSAAGFEPRSFEVEAPTLIKGLLTLSGQPTLATSTHVGDAVAVSTPPVYIQEGVAYSYQWLRNGSLIKNQTSSSYTLQAADWHKEVSVRITASRVNYLDAVSEWTLVESPVKLVSKIVTTSNGFWSFDECEYGDYWSYGCWTTGYKYAYGGNMNYNGINDYTHMNLTAYSEFASSRVVDWRAVITGTVTKGLKVKVGAASASGMANADYNSVNSYSSGGKWFSRWSTIAPETQYDGVSWRYFTFVEARDANKKVKGTFKIVKVQIEVRYYN